MPENKASMSRSASTWKPILTLPYVSGGFEWSGFDYKGEPVPNNWPDVNRYISLPKVHDLRAALTTRALFMLKTPLFIE